MADDAAKAERIREQDRKRKARELDRKKRGLFVVPVVVSEDTVEAL